MKEKIFCVYCGKENDTQKKLCKKCFRKLHPKDHLLLEYIKSKIKGKCEDGLFSIIKGYIRSHLYGFIITCSILVTTVSMITNLVNAKNPFEIVTEKPIAITTQYEYQGTGLSKEEVAQKYIFALKENDISTAKGLQLKEFNRDVYNQLINDKNHYQDKIATSFELSDHRDIYFKNMKNQYYVGKSDYAQSTKVFGNYQTDNYVVFLPYCSYNQCHVSDVEEHDVEIAIEIQVIEIEGKNYILGDQISERLNLFEAIAHRSLFLENGDTSKFNFNEKFDLFNHCIAKTGISVPYTSEKYDKDCLKKIGYLDIPVQGW